MHLAHGESVLKVFPSYQMVPFILLFKTGLTVELYNIKTFILERRLDRLARIEKLRQAHHKILGDTEVRE